MVMTNRLLRRAYLEVATCIIGLWTFLLVVMMPSFLFRIWTLGVLCNILMSLVRAAVLKMSVLLLS